MSLSHDSPDPVMRFNEKLISLNVTVRQNGVKETLGSKEAKPLGVVIIDGFEWALCGCTETGHARYEPARRRLGIQQQHTHSLRMSGVGWQVTDKDGVELYRPVRVQRAGGLFPGDVWEDVNGKPVTVSSQVRKVLRALMDEFSLRAAMLGLDDAAAEEHLKCIALFSIPEVHEQFRGAVNAVSCSLVAFDWSNNQEFISRCLMDAIDAVSSGSGIVAERVTAATPPSRRRPADEFFSPPPAQRRRASNGLQETIHCTCHKCAGITPTAPTFSSSLMNATLPGGRKGEVIKVLVSVATDFENGSYQEGLMKVDRLGGLWRKVFQRMGNCAGTFEDEEGRLEAKRLLGNITPRCRRHIAKQIESALQDEVLGLEILGVGCMGEVSQVTLSGGQQAIVKTVDPEQKSLFLQDVAIAGDFQGLWNRWKFLLTATAPNTKSTIEASLNAIVPTLQSLTNVLVQALDMHNEACNLLAFQERAIPLIQAHAEEMTVAVPQARRPRDDDTSVLVMTKMRGQTLVEWLQSCGTEENRALVGRVLIRSLPCMVKAGVLHEDLHPANVMVEERTMGFIDFGEVVMVPPHLRQSYLELLEIVHQV